MNLDEKEKKALEMLAEEEEEEDKISCPDCGTEMHDAPGGGVKCVKCNYWFCF